MTTFKDWLIYYNNLDVEPFVCGRCGKNAYFFTNKNILTYSNRQYPDLELLDCYFFKAARNANVSLALSNQQNRDLHQPVKDNIVGGPSIIFQRHMQKGVTKIRNGETGYDCNTLYIWALSQDMHVGPFIRRREIRAEKSE